MLCDFSFYQSVLKPRICQGIPQRDVQHQRACIEEVPDKHVQQTKLLGTKSCMFAEIGEILKLVKLHCFRTWTQNKITEGISSTCFKTAGYSKTSSWSLFIHPDLLVIVWQIDMTTIAGCMAGSARTNKAFKMASKYLSTECLKEGIHSIGTVKSLLTTAITGSTTGIHHIKLWWISLANRNASARRPCFYSVHPDSSPLHLPPFLPLEQPFLWERGQSTLPIDSCNLNSQHFHGWTTSIMWTYFVSTNLTFQETFTLGPLTL